MNSVKFNEKKINFINRLKHSEHKMFCICLDVYKINEVKDYDKIYEVLSTLKNKKIKISIILIEKLKNKLENPDFEQDYWSKLAGGIYRRGHDSITLLKCLIYYDRSYYDKKNYYDLLGSFCKHLNELSKRWILRRNERSSI